MVLRAPAEHRLVGGRLMIAALLVTLITIGRAGAADVSPPAEATAAAVPFDPKVAETRGAINDAESRQREVLAHVFVLGREVRQLSKKSAELNRRALGLESDARTLAQTVHELETKSAERGRLLNQRLSSLYRRRSSTASLEWLFSAASPAELNRHHRFTKLMMEDDHRQMDAFVTGLREARAQREKLTGVVRRLVTAQAASRAQESSLEDRLREKSKLVAELRSMRDTSLSQLRELRDAGAGGEYAFFEKRGTLKVPIDAKVTREFGALTDPRHHFKLMHKGWFFASPTGARVSVVADGRVEVARDVPGFGPTIVVNHGDHYYSVYGCASRIKVREGAIVRAGDLVGWSGDHSPLFGPGVYFELRHFADAIDPRSWIKDPEFKTAESTGSKQE